MVTAKRIFTLHRKRSRRPEQDVQRAVVAHLEMRGARGMFFTHFPAGGIRSRVEAAIFRGLGLKAGVPDILIWHAGRSYALELKADTRGARLSPAQVETQRLMRETGIVVATAFGLDAALHQLEAWGVLRGNANLRAAECPAPALVPDRYPARSLPAGQSGMGREAAIAQDRPGAPAP